MSLHHLGLGRSPSFQRPTFSPTRSSFSTSPTSTRATRSTTQDVTQDITQDVTQDVTQDNKDVLLDRLSDLVIRLSREDSLEDSAVSAIHAEVSKIERHLQKSTSSRRRPGFQHLRRLEEVAIHENESYLDPLSPTRGSLGLGISVPSRSGSFAEDTGVFTQQSDPFRGSPAPVKGSQTAVVPSLAAEVAQAAEELAVQLAATITELRARKEESDHVHDLLVLRAQRAAERILLLEYKVAEMEDDLEANQSELKFLRIQLQAIEAQCSPYFPQDDNQDQELSESILNWKIDWEDINQRSKSRRRNEFSSESSLGAVKSADLPLRHEYSQSSVHDVG